jgi:hypothetical protein
MDRGASGWDKPVPVPAVEVVTGTRPDGIVLVHNQGLDVDFGDTLLGAEADELGAEEAVDAILRGHPEKAFAVGGEGIDGKVFESFSLAIGAKDVLLGLQAG